MMKRPLRKWTRVPVFCTGEKHEICWDERGRLWLPHHPSLDIAAIEAKLLRGDGRLDNLCLTFAGALRGSELCLEALKESMRFLDPQLKTHIEKMGTKTRGRQTAQVERDMALLEHYPLTLEKCRKLFETTELGRLDIVYDEEGHTTQVTKRLVLVHTNMSGQPLLRVGVWGSRSTLRIEIGIDPKLWAGLYAQKKVILIDTGTDHPSKGAFALMPYDQRKEWLYCIRYKRFIKPHEIELACVEAFLGNEGWYI